MTSDLPMPDPAAPGGQGPSCGWAIVGCGPTVRAQVAPALRVAAPAHPVTVWDRDPAAAALLADALPGSRVAAGLADCVGDPRVQAVYVAEREAEQREAVEAAAEARRAVLVEPPFPTDLAGAAAMVDAADGLVASAAFDQRWHPAHLALAEALDRGAVGEITEVRISFGCWLPGDEGSRPDAALTLAPQAIDLIGMLLGEDLIRLCAQISTRVHAGAPADGAVLSGGTRRGVLASVQVSSCTPQPLPRRRIEVLGTRGQLTALGTLGHRKGGSLTLTRLDGVEVGVTFDVETSPVAGQLERFSLAAIGASPWGYHLLRDLRLHRLLRDALP